MALTNFAALTSEQLTMWQRDTWRTARNNMFTNKFLGSDENAMIQRITELKKDQKGARAVITLVHDLLGDGVAGDNQLEGNEEAMDSSDIVIRIDQLRHGTRHQGKMADQKSVVQYRKESRNNLAYWLSDRLDQMAFLGLSGEAFSLKTDGTARVGSQLPLLDYAADVTAPTSNRYKNWDGTAKALVAANTATVEATWTPSWAMLVEMKAYAKEQFIRPIRSGEGMEMYNVFMTPSGIAKLKLDPDFMQNWRHAQARSDGNPLFKGTPVIFVDGLAIYEYRHVFHASTWGAGSNVKGQAVLLCGAQALGFADIGEPEWVEKGFDYENQQGISYGKICGIKKPVFKTIHTGTTEDFGVLRVNTAA